MWAWKIQEDQTLAHKNQETKEGSIKKIREPENQKPLQLIYQAHINSVTFYRAKSFQEKQISKQTNLPKQKRTVQQYQ